jgi:CheY-like chemotaxis protein
MAETTDAKKILLVDDEAGLAELLRDLLEMDGYSVLIAHDGEEAIEKLKEYTPDAIISDIKMPRMNGFEMFRNIKASPATAGIPVLFITGHRDMQVLEEARKLGVFGILEKPVDMEKIQRKLQELLRK